MPIGEETVVNVVNNVLHIFLALLGTYAAMFTLEHIIKFAAGAFSNVKVFSRFKSFNMKL